jgi:hypothetical protein
MDSSHRCRPLLKYPLIPCVLLLLACRAGAQNAPVSCPAQYEKGSTSSDDSVAAAARGSKNQKAHAKKVFSDEDMEAVWPPAATEDGGHGEFGRDYRGY